MVDTAPTNNPNKGKLLAALILGVPLLLMALATFMYTSGWMSPGGRVNNGFSNDETNIPSLASEASEAVLDRHLVDELELR